MYFYVIFYCKTIITSMEIYLIFNRLSVKCIFIRNSGTFLSANHWHFKIKFLRNLYFGSAFMSATKFDPTVVANSLRGFVILSLKPELIICNTKCFLTRVITCSHVIQNRKLGLNLQVLSSYQW